MLRYPKIEVIAFDPSWDLFQVTLVFIITDGNEVVELLETRLKPIFKSEDPSWERFESNVELVKLNKEVESTLISEIPLFELLKSIELIIKRFTEFSSSI